MSTQEAPICPSCSSCEGILLASIPAWISGCNVLTLPSKTSREARNVRNFRYVNSGLAQMSGRSTCGDYFETELTQFLGERCDSGLIVYALFAPLLRHLRLPPQTMVTFLPSTFNLPSEKELYALYYEQVFLFQYPVCQGVPVVVVHNRNDVLGYYRAAVHSLVDEMDGTATELDSVIQGLPLCVYSGNAGRSAGYVDDPCWEMRTETSFPVSS